MRNLLTVISYVPVLRDSLLNLAIHRMIKIDVCWGGILAEWGGEFGFAVVGARWSIVVLFLRWLALLPPSRVCVFLHTRY